MKQFLMIGAAALLAACAAPEQPDYWTATRTGHGAQPAAASTSAGGPDYRTAALAEAGQYTSVMRPGLHKTRTGAPWLVVHSSRYRSSGTPESAPAAARSAMAYMSSKWKAPYAAKARHGDANARFRIVTVDGRSFAVLNRIRLPLKHLFVSDGEALKQLYGHAAQLSGCTVTGPALIRRVDGTAEKLAAPVVCS
ncbi:hypothetical protein KUW17_10575 [Leisingera aquaemixtae]|uniref:hypothetical protein n=1 Tax=Leisingera TaxID=191028 RepID=UPI001C93F343|nr:MULTISPECIES: hypothetical protein [Leisingera]MBY6067186.1 hypothetical protein [Leisingera aquaemixtae]MCB4456586.1 hypothetical protein [Leisingera sp. McT4-56]